MKSSQATPMTRIKVGLFSVAGLAMIGLITVYVNDKPYWWRGCQLVHIKVEDATGLKTKSPIRSLGLEIGYLQSVQLSEEHVQLGICITAPVEVLQTTRAYIRGEGFLGDKFVELKPVRYNNGGRSAAGESGGDQLHAPGGSSPAEIPYNPNRESTSFWRGLLISEAFAEDRPADKNARPVPAKGDGGREIPVGKQSQDLQHVVNQVDSLVNEMTQLTTNLKEAIDPKELRNTMIQLNKTLENASRTLSPEGGLNTTAQRTLAKLEEAIENLRDMMARVNRGQGSLGMLINDPSYAEEIRDVIRNVNRLLGKVNEVRFVVDIGGQEIQGYSGGRGWFNLKIYPSADRYYQVGVSIDPRGKRTVKNTTVTSGSLSTTTQTTEIEEGGLLLDIMLGKIFARRYEFALGLLHGDGTASAALRLGPIQHEERAVLRADFYSRGKGYGFDSRLSATVRPFADASIFSTIYVQGGLESFRKVDDKVAFFGGAGVSFDDNDIKLLFALR